MKIFSMDRLNSFKIALIFSLTALIFAILPGILFYIRTGKIADYSPEIAILTATLIAIIWYTAYTYDNLKHQQKRSEQEMRSLSTALLSEMRWIYDILFEFAQNGNFSDRNTPTPLPTPILNSVIMDLSSFQGDTVHRITYIYRGLNHFEHKREQNRGQMGGETDSIRTIAAYICIGISELVPELKKEGGKPPKLMLDRAYAAHEIHDILPEDPFLEIRREEN